MGTIKAIICSVICGAAIYVYMEGFVIAANWLMLLWIGVLIFEPTILTITKNK